MEGRWAIYESRLAASAPAPFDDLCSYIPDRKVSCVDIQFPMRNTLMHSHRAKQHTWIDLIFCARSQSAIYRHETGQFRSREAVRDKRPHRLTQSPIGRAIGMNSVPLSPQWLDVDSGQVIDEWQPELKSDQLMGYSMIFNVLRGK